MSHTHQTHRHHNKNKDKKHRFIFNTMNQYALENTLYHNAILTLTNLRNDNITSIKSNSKSGSKQELKN